MEPDGVGMSRGGLFVDRKETAQRRLIRGGKPAWWAILYFIPFVQIIFIVLTYMAIAERFGRGVGTVLGLLFLTPIFVCILGFGSAQWSPPANDA